MRASELKIALMPLVNQYRDQANQGLECQLTCGGVPYSGQEVPIPYRGDAEQGVGLDGHGAAEDGRNLVMGLQSQLNRIALEGGRYCAVEEGVVLAHLDEEVRHVKRDDAHR